MQLGGSQAILRFAPLQLRFAKIATALQRYFCILLWQFNSKSIICFHIPLNPSVRRVRRVYTLILHFTYNYAIHFGTKTINPFCQCFLLVTFLSRKKSDKPRPLAPSRALISAAVEEPLTVNESESHSDGESVLGS